MKEIRVKTDGYTRIPNQVIHDSDLSTGAKAVYALLLNPEIYKIDVAEITKYFKDDAGTIEECIRELEKHNLVVADPED